MNRRLLFQAGAAPFPLIAAGSLILLAGCDSRRVSAVTSADLSVRLVEKGSAQPCAGIQAEVAVNRERLALLRSDEQGELPAAALASMPPGAMLLCLSDPGERFVATEVVLEATGRVEVELERGVMMELKVLGEGGEPLERAEATVWQLGSGKWRRFHLAGGAGRLGPLPFGPSKLVLEAPGQVTSLLDMELKPARKKPAPAASRTVRLQRGGASLRGRVALGKGTAMPREVLLRYDGAGQVREPGADGSFQFSGLAPLPGGAPRPAQLVVLKLDGKELYAREVAIGGGDVDVGILGLGR